MFVADLTGQESVKFGRLLGWGMRVEKQGGGLNGRFDDLRNLQNSCRIRWRCGFIEYEMNMTEAQELLRAYVRERSEAAFQELVDRYIDLVYSVAIRRAGGDSLLAEDITQVVFTDLARKAASLPAEVMLGGWLHRHAGFVASSAIRGEQRRRNREKQAIEMNAIDQSADAGWKELAPVLDEVMDELEPAERDAIVLRYFEQRDLRSIGSLLGLSEDAAQKRVSRAVDKLRSLLLERRGMLVPVVGLVLLLGTHAVQAAPGGLAVRVGKSALGAAMAGGAAGLLLKLLAPATLKLVFGSVVVVVLSGLVLLRPSGASKTALPTAARGNVAETRAVPPATVEALSLESNSTLAVADLDATSNHLHMVIVAADSGRPVPNVRIDFRGFAGDEFQGKTLSANRVGQCDVTFAREKLTELELTTRIDGFADTRLLWHPPRGEIIPAAYTLRLGRPVAIGGQVVDADGRAVAEARVGFNHKEDPASNTLPESHQFSWIEVKSDSEGRWSINRIAPEMLHLLSGAAKHPDHVESDYVSTDRNQEAERQLREGKYTFRLGRAVVVRGSVADSDGTLIAGANVLVGMRGMSDSREGISGADGTFAIKGCRPGKTVISAEAEGFSAATLAVDVSSNSEPVQVTLKRGKILRLRVANQSGQPVSGADVILDTLPSGLINARATSVQADFAAKTDSEGRMVWSNAPDAQLEFAIMASGYMRRDQVKAIPDGNEHVVTLPPAVVISGTVRDTETGQPIPRFRIGIGISETNLFDHTVRGDWSTIERFWVAFSGGKYRHTIEESPVMGIANPGFILKFEADGYAPVVSRVIAPEEVKAQIDVLLHPAKITLVTVLLPDGAAAASAEVGLLSPGSQLRLEAGGFSGEGNGASLLRTDANGQFRLPADPGVTRVVAADSGGYAEATPAALVANPVLRLQP
jgi:RNA polymerase sigma factor (sigma-70 family)